MSDEVFDIEAAYLDAEEDRRDLIRIRAYALVCADQAQTAKKRLEKAAKALDRARKNAERELARCRKVCEEAERAASFAARAMAGDVERDTRREAANALEELFG